MLLTMAGTFRKQNLSKFLTKSISTTNSFTPNSLSPMAEEEVEVEETPSEILGPSFPLGRIKKIMKIDQEINKVNSEAVFLVTLSTQLFLESLSEKSAEIAIEKKRKIVTLDHLRIAVKRHQPTSDFLLDSLPMPALAPDRPSKAKTSSVATLDKPLPVGTRRIDDIFSKSAKATQ